MTNKTTTPSPLLVVGLDRKVMRDTSFKARAVSELMGHRWCGDGYPNNGWPGVNEALAQYALERRKAHNAELTRLAEGQSGAAKRSES